jgi:hypothetical protein
MSSPNPIVSIVIPVYNGANYLREAIDSALGQTCTETEVIVVNDGSTDAGRTAAVARSFGERIRYFEQENGGVASALNLGIRRMRGRYFSWLSHDDVYHRDKVARQLACLDALKDDRTILFCNYEVIDHASRVTSRGSVEPSLLESSILLVVGTHINGCSLLIPVAAFEEAGTFSETLRNSQDNDLWLRMVMKGYRFQYMPEALVQSRVHPGQGSLTASRRHAQELRAFYVWAFDFIGRDNRVGHAAGIFRILLAKRLTSLVGPALITLSGDRSLIFAIRSLAEGAAGMVKAWMKRQVSTLPGASSLKRAVGWAQFRNSSAYWQRRYQRGETSGAGSYGRFAAYKAEVLNGFVEAHGVRKVAELGCGDGNQLKQFKFAQYLGVDVSAAAVDKCRIMYRDDPTRRFLVHTGADAIEAIRQFGPELMISLDVIFHLVEDRVFEAHIASLFDVSSRYVIVYSTNFDKRYDSLHQVDRRFTDYVEKTIGGWRLVDVLANPHKGAETQSDFYIYEKQAGVADGRDSG